MRALTPTFRPALFDDRLRRASDAPAVWLASDEADDVNGRRIVAALWDESLPIAERLEKAGAPAGWPQLGRPTITTR